MKRALSFLAPALLVAAVAHADNPALKGTDKAEATTTVKIEKTEKTEKPAPVMPEVGKAAPDFKLPSQDGKEVELEDYKGKWVVLYFYPKNFTGGCTMQAKNFEADLAKYKEKDAVILGVSLDPVESHKEFCAKESITFKLLSDADHKVAEKYGSLMEYKGIQYASRNTFLIAPDGTIAKVYAKVDPAKNSAEVLADLETLRKAKKS